MKQTPRVAVIGAGCSGITAIKNLLQAGVENVVCFEQNSQVGGNWIYSPKISHSSVCETTHIISSKKMSEYLDYPMPEDYPDYPSHAQVLAYFQSYAEHFGVLDYIRFNTPVRKIDKIGEFKWKVITDPGEEEIFDYVLVANGHHSVPRWPELPGHFEGEYLHSHAFKTSEPFKDKSVLVIGMGNSGCDCAVEVSRVAEYVAISQRSPQYVIPKFIMGKPTDLFGRTSEKLPAFIRDRLNKALMRFVLGRYRDYGLKEPNYPVTRDHPTVNSELLYMIRHGKVHPRGSIKKIEGQNVTFEDGTTEAFDCIIAATGYKIATPFFDEDFLDYSEAYHVPLYLRMFHPRHPGLIFIGLFQPQGAIWPGSDAQSKLVANYIMGRWKWPENIEELAEKDADRIEKDFLPTKRHSIEVHYGKFMGQLLAQIPDSAPDWKDHTARRSKEKTMASS